MKKSIFFLAGMLLIAPSVFAWDCDHRIQLNIFTNPYEYVINGLEGNDTTCWSADDNVPWNSTDNFFEFNTYYQRTFSRTVTIGSGSYTGLVAQCNINFYDPNASWWNFIAINVDVNHNGSHTPYTVYSNRGNLGNTNDWGSKWTYFNAQEGDVVTLSVTGANSYSGSGTKVQFGGCYIFQYP